MEFKFLVPEWMFVIREQCFKIEAVISENISVDSEGIVTITLECCDHQRELFNHLKYGTRVDSAASKYKVQDQETGDYKNVVDQYIGGYISCAESYIETEVGQAERITITYRV